MVSDHGLPYSSCTYSGVGYVKFRYVSEDGDVVDWFEVYKSNETIQ